MKLFKKLTVFTLVIAMLCSMSVFALEFPDVPADDKNQEAIDVLSSFGIIKGYDDGQFKPEKTVTRAEITSLIVRMLGMSSINTSVVDSPYTDVPGNHWAVSDIKTANSRNIIKGYGDGTFGPEDEVTYEQAVKMIVAMLGYEPSAMKKGGYTEENGWPNGDWASGYMQEARDLGILRNSEMLQTAPAPRKIIAQILYNSLEIDLTEKITVPGATEPLYQVQQGKNVLNYYLKLTKYEGTVIANSISRLDNEESNLMDDEIEIETKKDGDITIQVDKLTDIKDMLGINVYAYTKRDDTDTHNVLYHYMPKSKIKTTTISTNDVTITGFTSSVITYEKENSAREQKISLEDDALLIYNGKYMDLSYALNNDLAIPEMGTITVTDSGNGNSLINIQSYQNYVVKSTDSSTYEIFAQLKVGSSSSLQVPIDDEFNWEVKILKNNAEVSFSTIKANNVLTVLKSDDSQVGKKIMTIYVTDTKKTGKITEEDGENVYIADTAYKISPSLNGTDIADKIVYDASGTYYLDYFGNIAYADFNAASDTERYGYITGCGIIDDTAGDIVAGAMIYDYTTKTQKKYTFNTRVRVDGTSTTDHEGILDTLEETAQLVNKDTDNENADYSQPVKFVLNSNGKISEIDTVAEGGSESFVSVSNDLISASYNSANRYFTANSKTVARIDSKTIVFSVPSDRTESKEYSIKTYSYFKNGTTYNFEAFDVDENGIARIIVLYASNFDAIVHYDSPVLVVTEVGTMKTEPTTGEPKIQVVGYDIRHGSTVTKFAGEEEYLDGIVVGDVISYGVDNQGLINDQVFKYMSIEDALAGDYPEVVTGTAKQADKDNYPMRRVSLSEMLNLQEPAKQYYDNALDSIMSGYRHSYLFGTPIGKIVDDDMSITVTGLEPGETGFEEDDGRTFAINTSVRVLMYDDSLSGDKKLSVVDSGDIAAKLDSMRIYDPENPDASYSKVYVYVYNDTVRALYIIK